MTAETTAPTSTNRSRFLARALAVGATSVAIVAASGGVSNAYVGESKSLPYFHGSGSVTLSSTWAGTVRWSVASGSYCTYVQVKHVSVFGVDGSWGRLTSNTCTYGYTKSASWSRPTDRGYNGLKFRLCQDVPNSLDSCGGSVTIYN